MLSGEIAFSVQCSLSLFQNESGCHRFQRVPPTEKRGRVHTSSITVSVFSQDAPSEYKVLEKDLRWRYSKGRGKGGQRKNKVMTKVTLLHVPTKIEINIDGRNREANRQQALTTIEKQVQTYYEEKKKKKIGEIRSSQVGLGLRSEKRRTVKFQHGIVIDHVLGKKIQLEEYLSGNLSEFYEL